MVRKYSWAEQALLQLVQVATAIWPLGLGLAILVSGSGRFAASSWHTLMLWSPYWLWGLILIAGGALSLCPKGPIACAGYTVVATWSWLWAASFVLNIPQPNSALTGIPTYGFIALVYTGFAVATFMDRVDHV